MFYNMFFGDCWENVTVRKAKSGGFECNDGKEREKLFAFVCISKGNYRNTKPEEAMQYNEGPHIIM